MKKELLNTIKIQIYTTLIVCLLLYIFKIKLNSKLLMLVVARIIGVNTSEDYSEDIEYLLTE